MYEISKIKGTESFIFSQKLKGIPLKNSSVIDFKTFEIESRSSLAQNNTVKKIIKNIQWLIKLLIIQIRGIIYFQGRKISIVHIHSQLHSLIAVWGWITGKKVFLSFHGEDYNNLIGSKFLQFLLFPYHKIFVISPLMKGGIIKYFKKEVIYTPNGVDKSIFYDREISRERKILCVASFKKVKRHELLLDGFSEFIKGSAFQDYKLVLAGEGILEDQIRKKVEKLGISDRVNFIGNLNSFELSNLYNESELLILVSKREGFPKVILEGLSCGIKVVSTPVGSITEIFGPNYPYILNDITPNGIKDALVKILTDNDVKPIDIDRYSWDNLRTIIKSKYE